MLVFSVSESAGKVVTKEYGHDKAPAIVDGAVPKPESDVKSYVVNSLNRSTSIAKKQ